MKDPMKILRSKNENQRVERLDQAESAGKRQVYWNQGRAGAKPGHAGEGYGKRVRRAGVGAGASEYVRGDLGLVCKHHNEQREAEGPEQGAAAEGAPGGAEEEQPEQPPENN
jgi:hypothetical protein